MAFNIKARMDTPRFIGLSRTSPLTTSKTFAPFNPMVPIGWAGIVLAA